jgi:hypothetical protein
MVAPMKSEIMEEREKNYNKRNVNCSQVDEIKAGKK